MQRFRFLVTVLAALSAGVAYASDWHFAGSANQGKDEASSFFDADSVSHPTKDTTRGVWVESIRVSELDHYRKRHNKLIAEKTARKIAAGYVPFFLLLPSVQSSYAEATELRNGELNFTSDEVMANAPDIQLVSKLYLEIDCTGKRIKLLDGFLYNDSGEPLINSKQRNRDFQLIAPDSNGDWLSLLVYSTN